MTAGSHKLREHPPRRCCVSVVAAHALGRKSARPVPPRPGNPESIVRFLTLQRFIVRLLNSGRSVPPVLAQVGVSG